VAGRYAVKDTWRWQEVTGMTAKTDLYNNSYGNYERDVYREVRLETYGEDFGQTSWVSTEESHEIPRHLELTPGCSVLEIGSGSGSYALYVAETAGCQVVGLDLNAEGIRNASALAERRKLVRQVSFQECDVSRPLPFADGTFNAAFSNDVFCHIPGRRALLRELWRVLQPGGRLLFSDALVVGGTLSNMEIATRSLIGYYLFVPPGENEKLMVAAGFQLIDVTDTTQNAADVARRWRQARDKREPELTALEGKDNFDGLQKFLACVQTLTGERRLLRLVYLARKNA
jgi:ubiquinone/menaquinone biosynthesis C-methylase UbiE